MIPKKIHYVWFGGKMPVDVRFCLWSWRRRLPDYEFKCWNEKNFDIHSVPFVEQAYKAGKYAFCADYIRLYALATEGGIYLDTDVLMLKGFGEGMLSNRLFSAIELLGNPDDPVYDDYLDANRRNRDRNRYVPYLSILSAVIGAEPATPFIGQVRQWYEENRFVRDDGSYNTDVMITMHLARVADDYGYRYVDELQHLADGVTIYPASVLASKFGQITRETVAVHCALGGWTRRVTWKDHWRNLLKMIVVWVKFG